MPYNETSTTNKALPSTNLGQIVYVKYQLVASILDILTVHLSKAPEQRATRIGEVNNVV